MTYFQLTVLLLNIGATIALIVRLCWNRLFREYPLLFLYLILDTVESVSGMLIEFHGTAYGYIYMYGQGVKLVLAVFVILDLYKLALAAHPALARFGRTTVAYVLAAAALIASSGLVIDAIVPPERSRIMFRFLSFERTMDGSLLIFLILISLFMMWFPVRLKPNVALYITVFMVYFLARASGLLLINILPRTSTRMLSQAMMCVSFVCLMSWVFALRREGEETTTVIGHSWNPAAIDRLSGQLDSINSSLARFGQR